MTKPIKPNITIPAGFAENGTKTDFLNEQIQNGFDPVDPDVLAGDNLNKLIDDTYKGLNYTMDGVNDLYKGAVLYDENETYNNKSIVFNINESGEVAIYLSLIDENAGNLLTDETKWQKVDLGSTINLDKINQSKALETGSISSDADVYADVQKYAHSTFDLSKFEAVGSPVISDDGVASGFSHSDYINLSVSLNNTQKITNYIKGTFINTSNPQILWSYYTTRLEMTSTTITFKWLGTNLLIADFKTPLQNNDIFEIFLILNDNGQNKLVVKVNGQESINITNNTALSEGSILNIRIGDYYQSDNYSFVGTIDLKSVAIWADNIPVFSGNQAGIDTVKPDDYTVVGSPVISDDGVVSGFSYDNFIQSPHFSLGNDIRIKGKFRTGSDITTTNQFLIESSYIRFYLILVSDTYFIPNLYVSDGTNSFYMRSYDNNFSLDANTDYTYELGYNSTTHYLYFKVWEDATDLLVQDVNHTLGDNAPNLTNISDIYQNIGTRSDFGFLKGSIDLNAYKVYVDGDLVYQPCLKIPYTLSKTGSKIVDAAYRDRVQDVYEQYGVAMYYTLDEENRNFTLPMGEIYGMIEKTNEAISKTFVPLENISIAEGTTDLSTYLPADGAIYLVWVEVSTSGKSGTHQTSLSSDVFTVSTSVSMTDADDGRSSKDVSTTCIPVGAERKITKTGDGAAYLKGYCKL